MNRIIFGRISDNNPIALNNKVELCKTDKFDGDKYFDTRNSSVESFLTSMKTVSPVVGTSYWRIDSIHAFIEEVGVRMPKIVDGMDELDQYYAEQVLDFIPHALLNLNRDVLIDINQLRSSVYYVRTVGNVVCCDLTISNLSALDPTVKDFVLNSPFLEKETHRITNIDRFIADVNYRLATYHVGDTTVIDAMTSILGKLTEATGKYRSIAFRV